jgi:hypothetical protein
MFHLLAHLANPDEWLTVRPSPDQPTDRERVESSRTAPQRSGEAEDGAPGSRTSGRAAANRPLTNGSAAGVVTRCSATG